MSPAPIAPALGRTALAVAHPGHELRLAKWVETVRPTIFVLTTGSRSGAELSRVDASARLAASLGAPIGEVFGRHLDRDAYGWIMNGEAEPFVALADELAQAFVRAQIDTVVTDGWQLYNVIHDLWHLTVRLAAAIAGARRGRAVDCLDYPVVPAAAGMLAPGAERLRIELSDQDVERKMRLIESYAGIADDAAEAIRLGGEDFVRFETLHAPASSPQLFPANGRKPLYETFGEARVAAGLYDSVLRWRNAEPVASRLAARLGALATAEAA
jgi:hypothetical protein